MVHQCWHGTCPLRQIIVMNIFVFRRDRVHLQVVNPDKNVTSVFVSFLLTIVAEVRPTFDQGILRYCFNDFNNIWNSFTYRFVK